MRFSIGFVVAAASVAAAAPAVSFASTSGHDLQLDGFTDKTWIAAVKKAREIVSQMTLEEKVNLTDIPSLPGDCKSTYPIERFGIRSFCYGDGPSGANTRYSTQVPTEVTTAATFDRDLFRQRGELMGKEFSALGINVALSIVAGPMGRNALGGRNWENFSPDVYLTSEAVKETVPGFQKHGVTALMKHFYGNEQELFRIGAPYGGYLDGNANQTVDSIIDDTTVHQLYGYPFAEAIRVGAAGVMCAYNQLNGTVACESDPALNKLLKYNLHGFVMTDYSAAWSTVATATNGTDILLGRSLWGADIAANIANGTLPTDLLDDKLVRFLTPYFALDQASLPVPDYSKYVTDDDASALVRKVAEDSFTLLKNVRSSNDSRGLPLKNPHDLLLVGSPAGQAPYGYVSNVATSFFYTTGTQWPGFVTDGFGSGGSPVPYAVDPFNAIAARGRKEKRPVVVDAYLSDNATEGWATVPGAPYMTLTFLDNKLAYADSAIVFVSATAMEGYDRPSLQLERGGDDLIKYTAERHNDTVVCVTAPGPVDMSQWADHPNVTSIVYTYFPTTEGGPAIASLLFGDVSPSGKLPFTIAKTVSDYDNGTRYDGPVALNPVANFTEGVFIDYRYFDAKNITPLYEFGYGLSYSSFSFSDLKVAKTSKKNPAPVRETNEKLLVNGKPSTGLYDIVYTVKATVKNTGSVAAAEVAQLYLSYPSSTPRKMPVRSLRGFEKPFLQPGKSKTVAFELRNKDLAYYSTDHGAWVVPEGEFVVSVGSSSRKLKLTGKISI
ncbi:hypothetical protein JCM8097_007868 [Rhodosporidiobolus ruineniae]